MSKGCSQFAHANVDPASSHQSAQSAINLLAGPSSRPAVLAALNLQPPSVQASPVQPARRRRLSEPILSQAPAADDAILASEMHETEILAEDTALLEAQVAGLRRLVEQADHLAQMPRISTAFSDAAAALHVLQAAQQSFDVRASAGSKRGRQEAAAGFATCVSRLAELAEGFRASLERNVGQNLQPAPAPVSTAPHDARALTALGFGGPQAPASARQPLALNLGGRQAPVGVSGSMLARPSSLIEQARQQTMVAGSSRRSYAPRGSADRRV